ncbi:DNA polymerase II, partial [Candidatus Bathyarchaeota archaeon]
MTEVRFYLLDLDYRFRSGTTEVRLWGITDGGERAVLFDSSLRPYFYVVTEKPNLLEPSLKNVPGVWGYELKRVKLFGKPVDAFKVYVSNPGELESVAKTVSKLDGSNGVYEDDLRHTQHYLLDYDVRPCGWHVAEVENVDKDGFKVDGAYRVLTPPRSVDHEGRVVFRVLAFYMVPLPSRGSPRPERDRIACLAVRTNDGFEEVLDSERLGEKEVLRKFIEIVDEFDPDIIVGYGTNRRDWEYLVKRARVNGLTLRLGRDGSEPHRSLYGHVSIAGRIALDLYDYAEDISDIKIKTLENLASYIGAEIKAEPLEETDIAALWATSEGRRR